MHITDSILQNYHSAFKKLYISLQLNSIKYFSIIDTGDDYVRTQNKPETRLRHMSKPKINRMSKPKINRCSITHMSEQKEKGICLSYHLVDSNSMSNLPSYNVIIDDDF